MKRALALSLFALSGCVQSAVIPGALATALEPIGPALPSSAVESTVRPIPTETLPTPTENQEPPSETTNAAALKRWEYFNSLTKDRWKRSSFPNIQVQYENITRKSEPWTGPGGPKGNPKGNPNPKTLAKRPDSGPDAHEQLKRRDSNPFYDWVAEGFDPDSWGWYYYTSHTSCSESSRYDFISGFILKLVVKETPDRGQYKRWWNRTKAWTSSGSYDGECYLYDGWDDQCSNMVWNAATKAWVSWSGNSGLGWTTNNASYNGHTVRTIRDCLLDNIAVVQYNTVVSDIGAKPIQYKVNGVKYYRWYDANNFAWFAACPPGWTGKKLMKKSGIGGRNSNPIWDFGSYEQRHPRSDMTPFPEDLIDDYDWQDIYAVMYWPEWPEQTMYIQNELCQIMALSRPGLRHWTARMIDIPAETFPSIKVEYQYPSGWVGFEKHAKGPSDSNSYYWGYGP